MSTTMFFFVPVGLLVVAGALCFVGCAFPTSGLPGPPYSNVILQETSLVAYWPLSDLKTSTIALDLSGNHHDGTYTIPPAYQMGTTAPQVANPTLNTGLILQQPSIVPGDALQSGSKNLPFSAEFEGGYVSIPWAPNSPQLTDFTIEAWVKPTWQSSVTGFNWVVFSAATNSFTGFGLYINAQNQWEILIGSGAAFQQLNTFIPVTLPDPTTTPPTPAVQTYVAVTFGQDNFLRLWINPQNDGDTDTPAPPNATWTSPTTVLYTAVDPTQQPLTFFIGAGNNNDAQDLRTQPGGLGAPLDPFEGFIQSVALYQTALEPTDLAAHFENGAEEGS